MKPFSQIHLRLESLSYLPFLYYTKTIFREFRHLERATIQATFLTASRLCRYEDGVTEYEAHRFRLNSLEKRSSFLKAKSESKARRESRLQRSRRPSRLPKDGNSSTITVGERRVFRNIFKEIAAGSVSKTSKASPVPQEQMRPSIDYQEIFSMFRNGALEDPPADGKKLAVTGDPKLQRGLRRDEESSLSEQDRRHIQNYPERLRKIASRATLLAKGEVPEGTADESPHGRRTAQGQPQVDGTTESPQNDLVAAESEFSEASAVQRRAIDSICVAQMERISELLIEAAAVTDQELWAACEKFVFPLLEFLEMDPSRSVPTEPDSPSSQSVTASLPEEGQQLSSPPSTKVSTTNPKSHHHKLFPQKGNPRHDSPTPQPLFQVPGSIPPLPIISTLYPALLLLTIRLLTTLYPLSPYPDNLLPRIRSLGLRSYVLGTSTQLYNVLLAHRWHAYSDLRGMDGLLKEMERGGVDFDAETVDVLERVRAEKVADELAEANAKSSRRGSPASLTPEQKKKKKKTGTRQKGASAGKRARSWWQGEVTRRWLERVVGEWRVKVMERVREKGAGAGGQAAVVEREYASTRVNDDGGEDDEVNRREVAIWL